MRTYTKRERVLAAITVPIWLAVVVIFVGVVVTVPDARTNVFLWLGGLGGVGATFVAMKIAVTGRSLRCLDQDAVDALAGRPLPPNQ